MAALAIGAMAVMGVVPTAHASTGTYPAPRVGSKITKANIADPSMLSGKHDGYYYLYTTGSGGIAVYRSTKPGSGYTYDRTISFKGYSLQWAPHVEDVSGRYFLFFTAEHNTPQHCVDMAASSTPDRGYTAYGALKCDSQINQGWEAIDPTVYETGAHNYYLVWRRGHVVNFPGGQYQIMAEAITLHGSGKPVTMTPKKKAFALTPIQNSVIEAPSLVFHNGRFWLFVSRNAYNTATGPTAYFTQVWSGTKLGMFTDRGTVMSSGAKYGYGPGGGEATVTNGTTYFAYEFITAGSGTNHVTRHVDIATISWKSGSPVVG